MTVNVQTGTLTEGKLYGFVRTSDGTYSNANAFVCLTDEATAIGTPFTLSTQLGDVVTGNAVYVKEYVVEDKLFTYYTNVGSPNADGIYDTLTGQATNPVDDDVEIIYVNVDKDSKGDDIGVNGFNTMSGKANAMILYKTDGTILTIIVETSDKADING